MVESGLAPHRLHLAISESVLLAPDANNISTLHQLRNLGVGIVLDGFATGFSSLTHVQQFPFDKIKIGKSLVDEIARDSSSAAIICAINALARGLDIVTIADGIETHEQCELLRLAGCDEAQGPLFGAPVAASALDFAKLDERIWRFDAA